VISPFHIVGTKQNEPDPDISREFWESVTGSARDARLQSQDFLTGFVEGAVAVYAEVRDEI
jgi:hypothetical protein